MILVLRALGIGDLATAVPALRGLRRAYPDDQITLAAPRWLAPLVELTGATDRLLPVADLRPRGWPARFDLAVNLHGRGPQSHRRLAAGRPARMLAFACPEAGWLDGPEWTDDEHEVARWCRLLAWYGIASDPDDLALPVPAGGPDDPSRCPPGGLTLVHPGAKAAARRWPPRRYAEVARRLAADGHRVAITGSASERGLAHEVAEAAGLAADAVLAGRTDVAGLAAAVARARLVVAGDTGIGHLATAYGTPSVLLFGPMPPQRWGPPPDRPRHRVLWPAGPGAGPVLLRIGVDDVLAAVDQALAATAAG